MIERVSQLGREEFAERFLRSGPPVIVTDGLKDWAGKTLPASVSPDLDEPLTEEQLIELRAVAAGVEADPELFCEYVSMQWGYPVGAF